MRWSHSDKTAIGEQNFFNKNGKYVLVEKTEDGYVEWGSFTNKERIILLKEIEIANEFIRNSIETTREGLRQDLSTYETLTGSDLRYNGNAEWQRDSDD